MKINDNAHITYNINSQIKFKTTTAKSSLCDYSNAYLLVKGTVTITGAAADALGRQADKGDKEAMFKNYAPFVDFICEINSTQVDYAKDHHIVMTVYNVIEYNGNYSKTFGSL